jgi:hypothetical protein
MDEHQRKISDAFQAGCRLCLGGLPINDTVRRGLGYSNAELRAFDGGYWITREVIREVDSDPYLREQRARIIRALGGRAAAGTKFGAHASSVRPCKTNLRFCPYAPHNISKE